MNFICCSENCKYQENGYCQLKNPAIIYIGNNSCWYFEEKNSPPKDFSDEL
ncbi:MAG: hypothetical protein ACI4KH_06315 [Oscillospiraceae bacterium]